MEGIGRRVCEVALRHGVLLRPLGDTIVLWPPLAISLEQLAEIVAAVDAGLRKLRGFKGAGGKNGHVSDIAGINR